MSLLVHRRRSTLSQLDSKLWARTASLDGNAPLVVAPVGDSAWPDTGDAKGTAWPDADLQAKRVEGWCRRTPQVAAVLGGNVRARPLSGGMTNASFLVEGSKGKAFVKHAEAFHRIETAIPLSLARQGTEAAGMRVGHALAPEAVPACIHYDSDAHMLATRFVEGREMLPSALLAGAVYPGLAAALGSALARLAVGTSRDVVGRRAFAELAAAVEGSSSVADVMEDHVFHLPFDRAAPHNSWPAELATEVEALVHGNAALMAEVEAVRRLRRGDRDLCLAHTDVWLSNILVPAWPPGDGAGGASGGSMAGNCCPTIVDFEFGAIAPAAYDAGHSIGMLVLAAVLVRVYSEMGVAAAPCGCGSSGRGCGGECGGGGVPAERRREQERWLLDSICELWSAFERSWADEQRRRRRPLAAWARRSRPPPALADALGFAGCTVVRWSIGQFNLFKSLGAGEEAGAAHVAAVRRAVQIGAALLVRRRELSTAEEVANVARAELL